MPCHLISIIGSDPSAPSDWAGHRGSGPPAPVSSVAWTGSGDGTSWTNPNNWTSAPALPAAGDDVTIPAAAGTIHLASGTQSIHSLTSGEAVSFDGGTLNVGATAVHRARDAPRWDPLGRHVDLHRGGKSTQCDAGRRHAQRVNLERDAGPEPAGQCPRDRPGRAGAERDACWATPRAARTVKSASATARPPGASPAARRSCSGPAATTSCTITPVPTGDAGVLTIGPGITLHGSTGQISRIYGTAALSNQGTISADVAGAHHHRQLRHVHQHRHALRSQRRLAGRAGTDRKREHRFPLRDRLEPHPGRRQLQLELASQRGGRPDPLAQRKPLGQLLDADSERRDVEPGR